MVERSEIITLCRQMGGMMDAGVDILRITKVLRAQTENPRLLAFYDELDHRLKMGASLSAAMSHAPDIFSPFAVSLVRESEDPEGRSGHGLGKAFLGIADFLQKDEEVAHDHGEVVHGISHEEHAATVTTHTLLTVSALDGLIDHFQLVALRGLTILAGLFLALASVWASVEAGWLEPRWQNVTLCSVGALFIGGAGIWVRRSIEAERKRGARCSFCGQISREAPLQQASRYTGVTICPRCAASIARQYENFGTAAGMQLPGGYALAAGEAQAQGHGTRPRKRVAEAMADDAAADGAATDGASHMGNGHQNGAVRGNTAGKRGEVYDAEFNVRSGRGAPKRPSTEADYE